MGYLQFSPNSNGISYFWQAQCIWLFQFLFIKSTILNAIVSQTFDIEKSLLDTQLLELDNNSKKNR